VKRHILIAMVLTLALPPAALRAQAPVSIGETEQVLATLVETYGVSGSEGPVREAIRRLLPTWAKPEVDTAGNLWLTVGRGDPVVVFVAHMDEVGFSVTEIGEDGTLGVTAVGGIFPSLWEGQPALVHTARGPIPGVFVPRDSAEGAARRTPPAIRVDIGAGSRAKAESLGAKAGHTVTMPKTFTRLAGTRATGRSFDDRVGSTALVLAARHLDRTRLRHRVILLWSVREETGLEGARVAADALGLRATRVHAVDTFVSADSPLESPRFALAPLGAGPVARALDNSSVTPPAYVDSLAAVARARGIPLQVGTTNGGNDGSVFARYGVPDVPLGWPLRYSHSPVETVDLRDVARLAELVRVVAERW
jgi:putative aminopeptidase FrvX